MTAKVMNLNDINNTLKQDCAILKSRHQARLESVQAGPISVLFIEPLKVTHLFSATKDIEEKDGRKVIAHALSEEVRQERDSFNQYLLEKVEEDLS